MRKKLVVLTGAGMSAESGINTFRDADGLWEGHDVMEVASPQGFARNPELVLDFYNQRRRQLSEVVPNSAHKALAALEQSMDVTIITQNVDDLHERAESSEVIHLHGELLKARSTKSAHTVVEWHNDLNIGDLCPDGYQLRPHIVWFGEGVPLLGTAVDIVGRADALFIIGTSMQVYPAAGLVDYVRNDCPIYFVDPRPSVRENEYPNLTIFAEPATIGVIKAIDHLLERLGRL